MPTTSSTINSRSLRAAKAAKVKETTTYEDFVNGYRNREDVSLLPAGTMIPGSYNVLVNRAGWIENRKGYIMDGSKSTVLSPIRAPFDWKNGNGYLHHLRAGFITSAGNDGKLQLRWVDTANVLGGGTNVTYWLDLLTGLTSTYFQYANYWDSTNLVAKLLMVNRTAFFYEWTGAIGTILSVTSGSITLSGSVTLAQLGFTSSGYIVNNGIVYQYDSISGQTFTLHSGTPDPTGSVIGSPLYQQPVKSSSFSSLTFSNTPTPASYFTLDLIAVIRSSNQVVVASILANQVYLSKAGTYVNYSQSTARLQYEGDMLTTIGPVVCFQPQEDTMYISAGLDEWYSIAFNDTTITNQTTATTLTYETCQLEPLKVAALQAAQSQYASTKIANDVAFLSNEPIVSSLGRVPSNLATPQISDLSFPIQNDVDAYNATDAWMAYNKKLLYVGFPQMGLFRIYNMTDPKKPFWEAPQNISLSGVSFSGTTVIGHSYQTSESYVMNTGTSDRANDANSTGLPISWSMMFAFQPHGLRAKSKSFNKFFVEGYMNSATVATVGLTYRSPSPGILPSQTLGLSGTGSYVLQAQSEVSLGKASFGKNPLGGDIQFPVQFNLPPYFAVFLTATRQPHLSYSPSVTGTGVGMIFKLLAYGNNSSPTSENETDITI